MTLPVRRKSIQSSFDGQAGAAEKTTALEQGRVSMYLWAFQAEPLQTMELGNRFGSLPGADQENTGGFAKYFSR